MKKYYDRKGNVIQQGDVLFYTEAPETIDHDSMEVVCICKDGQLGAKTIVCRGEDSKFKLHSDKFATEFIHNQSAEGNKYKLTDVEIVKINNFSEEVALQWAVANYQ